MVLLKKHPIARLEVDAKMVCQMLAKNLLCSLLTCLLAGAVGAVSVSMAAGSSLCKIAGPARLLLDEAKDEVPQRNVSAMLPNFHVNFRVRFASLGTALELFGTFFGAFGAIVWLFGIRSCPGLMKRSESR